MYCNLKTLGKSLYCEYEVKRYIPIVLYLLRELINIKTQIGFLCYETYEFYLNNISREVGT